MPRATVAADSLGLSQRHISPPQAKPRRQTWELEIARGGNCASLRAPYRPRRWTARKRKSRGNVRGFSAASRRRLQTLLHSLDQRAEGLPLFATLTYPGGEEWAAIPRERFKRDLDGFLKRLLRLQPDAHGIWKLEPQKRGATHHHLLIWGVGFIPIEELSRLWWEVVGSGDDANLKNGVHVRRARTWRGIASYAAKYVAKVVDELPPNWTEPGRWWGRFNRTRFRIDREVVCVDRNTATRLRRLGARVVFRKRPEARTEFLSIPNVGITVHADEMIIRKALSWAQQPRWACGLIRPGDHIYYLRRRARRKVHASPHSPRVLAASAAEPVQSLLD